MGAAVGAGGPEAPAGPATPPEAPVLVWAAGVGPEEATARRCADLLRGAGLPVTLASGADRAQEEAARDRFDAAVWVLPPDASRSPAGGGPLPGLPDEVPVVAVGVPDGPPARALMLSGIFLTLEAPGDGQDLARAARRAAKLGRELAREARWHGAPLDLRRLLGAGGAVHEALRLVPRAAETIVPVLVVGEAGAGKHLAARAIHEMMRPGRSGPYVRAALSAFHPGRLREDLFGTASRPGYLERAAGGTLFLDGVGLLPPDVQARLVEMLQAGPSAAVPRADGSGGFPGDVRLIAGSTVPLEEEVERGRLREDLFYRLKVLPLRLPPLRQRPEDLPVLAVGLIDWHAAAAGRSIVGPSPAALRLMARYHWPGNLRELDDRIGGAVRRCRGASLVEEDLPELADRFRREPGEAGGEASTVVPVTAPGGIPGAVTVELALDEALPMAELGSRAAAAIEIAAIRRALKATGGNVTHAAKALQISRIHLQKRMKLYKLRETR